MFLASAPGLDSPRRAHAYLVIDADVTATRHADRRPALDGKSKRAVPLPAELVPVLTAYRKTQLQERLAAGDGWHDHGLVFCRPDGLPIPRNDDWRDWKDILKAAGVRDARVHDGWHTAGTLLIAQDVHVRTVQEILGHSKVTVTERVHPRYPADGSGRGRADEPRPLGHVDLSSF